MSKDQWRTEDRVKAVVNITRKFTYVLIPALLSFSKAYKLCWHERFKQTKKKLGKKPKPDPNQSTLTAKPPMKITKSSILESCSLNYIISHKVSLLSYNRGHTCLLYMGLPELWWLTSNFLQCLCNWRHFLEHGLRRRRWKSLVVG